MSVIGSTGVYVGVLLYMFPLYVFHTVLGSKGVLLTIGCMGGVHTFHRLQYGHRLFMRGCSILVSGPMPYWSYVLTVLFFLFSSTI